MLPKQCFFFFFFCILTVPYEFYGVIHHMLKWGNHCFQKIKISKSNKQYRCRRNRIENWVEDHSIVGKESTWNAGDPSLIPGSGRSPEERIIYPLKYSWASLVSQLETNLPATWQTWVWSLDCEDPLEKGKATHSNKLAWRIPWTL